MKNPILEIATRLLAAEITRTRPLRDLAEDIQEGKDQAISDALIVADQLVRAARTYIEEFPIGQAKAYETR